MQLLLPPEVPASRVKVPQFVPVMDGFAPDDEVIGEVSAVEVKGDGLHAIAVMAGGRPAPATATTGLCRVKDSDDWRLLVVVPVAHPPDAPTPP